MQQSSEIDECETHFLQHGHDLMSLSQKAGPSVDQPRGSHEAYINRLVIYLVATWVVVALSWGFFSVSGGTFVVLLLLCMLPIVDCLLTAAGWTRTRTTSAEPVLT